jgi:hypothetical protein
LHKKKLPRRGAKPKCATILSVGEQERIVEGAVEEVRRSQAASND